MLNASKIQPNLCAAGATLTIFAWLFAGVSVHAEEAVRVPADMIKPLMAGTTIGTKARQTDRPMTWYFRPDGRLDGELETPYRVVTDEGKWWTTATGLLCFKWQRWGKAKRRCRIPSLAGDRLYGAHPRTGKKFDGSWKIKEFGPQSAPVVAAVKGSAPRRHAAIPSRLGPRPTIEADSKPPTIDVPASLSTDKTTVDIEGRVADASQIVEVSLNGRPIPVSSGGKFSVKRGVPIGKSQIVIAVIDEWGNRAQRKIDIRRSDVRTAARTVVPARITREQSGTSPFAGLHFGSYHALVIGNNKYRYLQKLKSARNDADAVAETLAEEYGFRVTKLTDASRSQILGTLAKFRATLKPDDNLLIYYAGHGIVDSITEQGYWLPVDAEQQNPANWISNTDLTNMLRAIRARHVMVVADSCYSGTLVRAASAKLQTSRDKVKWAKRMLGKRGRTALVSGGLEPVVDSGTGTDHSVFAQAFIKALKENREILEGQALFDQIKRPVVLNADQTPQYSDIRMAGHEGGEFMFVRRSIK